MVSSGNCGYFIPPSEGPAIAPLRRSPSFIQNLMQTMESTSDLLSQRCTASRNGSRILAGWPSQSHSFEVYHESEEGCHAPVMSHSMRARTQARSSAVSVARAFESRLMIDPTAIHLA